MRKQFEIKNVKGNIRQGKLRLGDLELTTPLVAHPAGISKYLRSDQIVDSMTTAIYIDPLRFADQLQLPELTDIPNFKELINWQGALFTSSGSKTIAKLAKPRGYKANGVNFRRPVRDQLVSLSPEDDLRLQERLGTDMGEQLYRDVDYYAPVDDLQAGVEQTATWFVENSDYLFPITGGGLRRLQQESIETIAQSQPMGYLLSQSEQIDSLTELQRDLSSIFTQIPESGLRVANVGSHLDQVLTALEAGVDVINSEVALHEAKLGNALVGDGERLNLKHAHFANEKECLDKQCNCVVCTGMITRAYLHYLAVSDAPQYKNLILEHNLYWLNQLLTNYCQ